MARFKDPVLRVAYDAARRVSDDNFSEFYYSKTNHGPCHPRRGAAHRNAYWNGWSGNSLASINGSLAHAFWAAGQDDRKDAIKRGGNPCVPFQYSYHVKG